MTLLNRFLIWKQRKYYHYSTDTLTLDKWWKLQEVNDLSLLSKNDKIVIEVKLLFDFLLLKRFEFELVPDHSLKSSMIRENIINEWIKDGGFSPERIQLLELQKKHIDVRSDWLLSLYSKEDKGKKMKSKFIALEIEALENEMSEKGGVSKEESLIIISEALKGGHISPKNITVKQFQEHLKYYSRKK